MNCLKMWCSTALCAFIALSPATPANGARVEIPGGTPVIVKLLSEIGSGTQKKGDRVAMAVASDVYVKNQLVIKAGTPVEAKVDDVSKRFIAGIGGYLKLSVQSVTSTGGTVVPIKFEQSSSGETSLWSVILGVVCCICVLLIPGKDVTIQAGTLYNATTLGPTDAEI